MVTKRHLRRRCLVVLLAPACAGACSSTDPLEPVYCYRTLADVSCYAAPDPGREAMLVGTYLREPAATSGSAAEPAPSLGWLAAWGLAAVDVAGRILSPVGSVVGLVRGP